jgi:CheY-like chemotaxis protein
MNVLIVDDNEVNRALLLAILESYQEEKKLNLSFYEAEDGFEAVQMYKVMCQPYIIHII